MKDLEEIKYDYAKEKAFENWTELEKILKENNRFCITIDQISIRYANEQKRELVEMLELLVNRIEGKVHAPLAVYEAIQLINKHKGVK